MSLDKDIEISCNNKPDFESELFKRMLLLAEKEKEDFLKAHGPEESMDIFYKQTYLDCYKNVYQHALKLANKGINCGGYALEIDNCLFPSSTNFSAYVSGLLNEFGFIRLLGDEPLNDDEYLVFYRISNYQENGGINHGHHFVKVNDDGLVVEKNEANTPRIFTGWSNTLADSPEAVFAVKKEHPNLFDESFSNSMSRYDRLSQGLDFNDTVSGAITLKKNTFSYHGHNFTLKKSSLRANSVPQDITDDDIFVVDDNGEIVADVLTDGETVVVGIKKERVDYVENLSGPVKPIIENGRLVNFDKFKNQRRRIDTDHDL